jgi:hypothetical protein
LREEFNGNPESKREERFTEKVNVPDGLRFRCGVVALQVCISSLNVNECDSHKPRVAFSWKKIHANEVRQLTEYRIHTIQSPLPLLSVLWESGSGWGSGQPIHHCANTISAKPEQEGKECFTMWQQSGELIDGEASRSRLV